MNHTPKYLEKLLPFTYDPKNLTIWGYASTEEEAEIANNVDPDLGPFIVTACNAHEENLELLQGAYLAITDPKHKDLQPGGRFFPLPSRMREALAKAGVKS